ncbi:MAG: membrane protein-like protein [Parcubacteria bacterium C7867-005]|nr:MAG: membrane protein-like protein [Parcubacteria bacterium C7867-005]
MELKHKTPTLDEVKEKRPILRNPVRETKLSLPYLDAFALVITRKVGSMGFFFLLCLWTVAWLLWNVYAPIELRFDPAPAFVIWLFISNLIQLVLLPMVMVAQNIEGRVADQRAQDDFEINSRSEKEIEVILAHLENQNELLMELSKKIDKK